jgi:3-hydroxymyristoyl/3-hydroxydecanoyl-(acyl carrier protein) dehydratase
MSKGGVIIFMQSVPSYYEPQLRDLLLNNEGIKDYASVAEKKYKEEQSLRKRAKEFEKQGVLFMSVCPPLVEDTTNIQLYFGRSKSGGQNPKFTEESKKISKVLGLPESTTKVEVGKKIVELLKRNDLPMGYIELFGNTVDARSILSAWYGQNAIYVDTFEKIDNATGIGRLIVTKEYAEGHLIIQDNEIPIFPGHKMIEAAAQTLGLVALGGKITNDTMPLFQGINGPIKFLKSVSPREILQIQVTLESTAREMLRNRYKGNARILNQKQELVAEINGLEAVVMRLEVAKKIMGLK